MLISDYLYKLTSEQAGIVQCLHDLIMETPAIEVKRRWNLPFYYRKSWICYFNILKNGNVEWAFTRGNELSNEDLWLEARGRKQIYSVNFASVEDIDMQLARVTFQEALLLDEHVPYSVKKNPSL
ncbi:MAG: hypothetical protein WBG42_09120 [Cryomorphaceae bacterium]